MKWWYTLKRALGFKHVYVYETTFPVYRYEIEFCDGDTTTVMASHYRSEGTLTKFYEYDGVATHRGEPLIIFGDPFPSTNVVGTHSCIKNIEEAHVRDEKITVTLDKADETFTVEQTSAD